MNNKNKTKNTIDSAITVLPVDCGCLVVLNQDDCGYIDYCPTHEQAFRMAEFITGYLEILQRAVDKGTPVSHSFIENMMKNMEDITESLKEK